MPQPNELPKFHKNIMDDLLKNKEPFNPVNVPQHRAFDSGKHSVAPYGVVKENEKPKQ